MAHGKLLVTGAAALNTTSDALTSTARLTAVLVHVSAAPVTSENLVVTLDSVDGAAYDTILVSQDLAAVTDLAYTDLNLPLVAGDALKVTYTNTDTRTVSVRLVLEL
jgi:hypothetical protein